MDPDLIAVVTERMGDALKRHMTDDATRFDRWFGGPNSSFVQQIAKKKRSRRGALEEDRVREVLLYLGWQAYNSWPTAYTRRCGPSSAPCRLR